MLVVTIFILLQEELIGRSHKSNNAIQPVPNKLTVFFKTNTTAFFVLPTEEMLQVNSPKNLNFFPETPWAIFSKLPNWVYPFFFMPLHFL